jgi:hypothetical protein
MILGRTGLLPRPAPADVASPEGSLVDARIVPPLLFFAVSPWGGGLADPPANGRQPPGHR